MADDIQLIEKLLKLAEGKDLDFNSGSIRLDTDYHKAKFVRNIICMANTPRDGSAFIINGVISKPDGTKSIGGVLDHPDDAVLQQLVASRVSEIPQFQYRPAICRGASLGITEIFPYRGGPFVPQFDFENLVRKGAIYYRQGSSTKIATSSAEIRDIIDWMQEKKRSNQSNYSNLKFLDIGGGVFNYPCYFPSISSLRTQYKPIQYLKILLKSGYPWFLISAYDIAHANTEKQFLLDTIKESLNNQKVLLDSGYYESSSRNDLEWSQEKYWDLVRDCDFTFAFSFDKRDDMENKSQDDISKEVVESWKRDVEATGKVNIIPIVHANKASEFPRIIPKVVQAINPIMIAVPERELGEGVISTARTIFEIRKQLHELGSNCPIHLLGTGNPISILIYTTCGANSYDGLEWCQMILNYNTALLHHMKHYDFLEYQSDWSAQPGIKRELAALMHNLEFYISWMMQLHTAINRNEIIEFLNNYLPLTTDKKGQIIHPLDLLKNKIPELFQDRRVE